MWLAVRLATFSEFHNVYYSEFSCLKPNNIFVKNVHTALWKLTVSVGPYAITPVAELDIRI